MDLLLITLIVVLLVLNIITIFFLLRNKQQKTEDPGRPQNAPTVKTCKKYQKTSQF